MVYPEGPEVTFSDGVKMNIRRPSYYNEEIKLNNYNVYIIANSGNLNSVRVSKEIIKSYKDEVEIILLNKSKLQVSCKTAAVANKIIKKTLASKDLNFYIPQQKVEVKGRIYMPKDISEKSAFEGMIVKNRISTFAPLPTIVEVYRVPYFEKDPQSNEVKKIDSDFMLVSFCGSHIPTHVLFENALLIPVQAYFEPILQCKSCWFFGHSKRACRGKPKCVTCGLTHSDECTTPSFCVNCKGNHCNNFKKCPEFLKRKELAKAKALKTVPSGIIVSQASAPASFNIFSQTSFPEISSRSFPKPSVNPVLPEKSIKKRRAENNINELEEANKITPELILEDITNKIIKDLSSEKDFFNSIVEDIQNSVISGEELGSRISNKIKEFMIPSTMEGTTDQLDISNEAVVTSQGS